MTKKQLIEILEDFNDNDEIIFGTCNREYYPYSVKRYNDTIMILLDDRIAVEKYYITTNYKISTCGNYDNPTDKLEGSRFHWNKYLCIQELNMHLIEKNWEKEEEV